LVARGRPNNPQTALQAIEFLGDSCYRSFNGENQMILDDDVHIALIMRDQGGAKPSHEVPMQLQLPTQVMTNAECWALARSIMYSVPLPALFLIEGVRVQARDAGGVFSVYNLVQELCKAKPLTFGVHMPAFWRALILTVARHFRVT